MKKTISILTAVAMTAGLAAPVAVFAAEEQGLQEAIGVARTALDIPAEYSEFSSSVNSNVSHTEYRLTWSTVGDSYSDSRSISVTVNDMGDILRYSKNDNYDNDMKLSKFSGEELKAKAEEWVAQVNPDWAAELVFDGDAAVLEKGVSDTYANVHFQREVNGLPFCGNYVSVDVNKQTGEIASMYSDWTYADTVPGTEEIIAVEEAQAKFAEYSPMELQYRLGLDGKQFLEYHPKDTSVMVSAADGSRLEYLEGSYNGAAEETANAAMASDSGSSGGGSSRKEYQLTEEELANVREMADLITVDAAVEQLKAMPELGISDFTLSGSSYSKIGEEGKEEYRLDLTLQTGSEDSMQTAHATLDAADGGLISYSCYNRTDYLSSEQETENKVSAEEARKTAESFASKYVSEEYAKTRSAEEDETYRSEYNTLFIRYENDIICPSDSISVTIDPTSGNVKNFYKFWGEGYTFESPDGMIDAAEAADALFANAGLQLQYVDINVRLYGEKPSDVRLAYLLNTSKSTMVSAKTGKLLNYDGSDYEDSVLPSSEMTDIAGHYGETAIRALLDNGVIEPEAGQTEFRPDDMITQEEMLQFVSRLMGYPVPFKATGEVYGYVIPLQIVTEEEKDPAKLCTREDAVKYIVRALGYEDVASLSGIFDSGFADRAEITADNEGYVAIAKGFGIVNGDEENNFNPTEGVSRADAAIMIYNYLSR